MKNRIVGILVVLMVMLGTISLRAEECTFQTEIALDMNKYPVGFKGVVDIQGNKVYLDVGANGVKGFAALNAGGTFKGPRGDFKDFSPTETIGGKDIIKDDVAIGSQHSGSHNKQEGDPYPPPSNYAETNFKGMSNDPNMQDKLGGMGLDGNNNYAVVDFSMDTSQLETSGTSADKLMSAISEHFQGKLSGVKFADWLPVAEKLIEKGAIGSNRDPKAAFPSETLRNIYNMQKEGKSYSNHQHKFLVLAMAGKGPCPKPDKETANGQPTTCGDFYEKIGVGQTTTCTDGTSGTNYAECTPSNTETVLSTSTSSVPDPSIGPMMIKKGPCDAKELKGYIGVMNLIPTASEFQTKVMDMNRTENIWKFYNPKVASEPVWKDTRFSYFAGERRTFNPFDEDIVMTGLPYKEYFTRTLDSWSEKEVSISPSLQDSVKHVREREAINRTVANQYSYPGSLNVYRPTPKGRMEIGFINPHTGNWNSYISENRYCFNQYELKVVPGARIYRITKYQKWKLYTGKGTTYSCKESNKCARWECRGGSPGSGYYGKDGTWVQTEPKIPCVDTCVEYYTTVKSEDHSHAAQKKNGTRTESQQTGISPPRYAERKIWKYRIGFENEFHAYSEKLDPSYTKVTPSIPRKDSSGRIVPGTIRSGYGVGWETGSKYVTDYDRPIDNFRAFSDVIRPNKDKPMPARFRNLNDENTKMFDSKVRYDERANAPDRSSSKNSTFIRENIQAKLIEKQGTSARNIRMGGVTPIKDVNIRFSRKDKEALGMYLKEAEKGKSQPRVLYVKSSSDPSKYYHAYWVTKGNSNLIPTYKPAPIHYIHLDYPSETDYTLGGVDWIMFNKYFQSASFNDKPIRVIGNMFEDSFSRPDFKKSINR